MITVRVAALLAVAAVAGAASAQSPPGQSPAAASPQVPERPAAWTPLRPSGGTGGPALQPQSRAPILPAPAVGAPVRDASGELLGRIDAVVTEGGRPVQVVVRTRGRTGVGARSRAVPVASLRPDGSGWVLPLRRAEFNLLPPVPR